MIINHNLSAMNANRNMNINSNNASKSMQKLSSGLRINNAADDAAGLAISEKMRGQIRGLDQASSNAQDGISLIQTAEGALNETHSILQRMRELAVQGSNDTLNASDRGQIQKEMDQLTSEIDRISSTTEFNTKKLLNGGAGLNVNFTSETVNTANADWMTVVGGSAATKTGTITITDGAKAVGATSTIAAGAADDTGTQTVTINGKSISFTGTTTAATNTDNFKAALDAVADELGITVTQAGGAGTAVTITTKAVGSAAALKIDAAANTVGVGAIATNVTGTDAVVNAGADISAANTIRSGNTIKVISGNYEGLELKLNDTVMDAVAGNNDAVFEIKANGTLAFQIGANEGQIMNVGIGDMGAAALGVNAISVSDSATATKSITTIQAALDKVSDERSKLGAYQNRLEHTIANLGTSSENMQSSESRIRDVDMAKEMSTYSKNNILSQAAQAMLAQANQQPQNVLSLLR